MKITVIGGSGLIGTKVVARLRQRGHAVLAASPRSGVNTVTGAGLAEAVASAKVVIDVANPPSFEERAAADFFEKGGRNLLDAEAAAGIAHHVVLSVVGTERLLKMGYFRAKLAQEKLVEASGIPYTIIRTTQFFEFIPAIARAGTDGQTARLSRAQFQPIAADDVADAVADVALAAPVNGIVEIAGPDRAPIFELVGRFLSATHDPRTVVADPHAGYFGLDVDDQSLTPGRSPRIGRRSLQDWLSQTSAQH